MPTVRYDPAVVEIGRNAVSPGEEFYRTYSPAQVGAIAGSLARRAEFPFELTYLGGGGELWRAGEVPATSEAAPRLGDFDTLLARHAERLLALVPPSSPVLLVDLGPGTTRPVRGLVRHLLDRSLLAGYRAIDLSAELLFLAGKSLSDEFPDHADRFELYRGDFTGQELAKVLTAHDPRHDGAGPARLVVLAGGTLFNFAEPTRLLRHVREAMSDRDVLLLTLRVDTGVDRPPFMDQVSIGGPFRPQQLAGLDLTGIDRSWYVTETGFDHDRSEIFIRVRFVEPVTVVFDIAGAQRTVSFEPGDTVLVWRYRYLDHTAVADQLTRAGFEVRLYQPGRSNEVVLVAATKSGSSSRVRFTSARSGDAG